MTLMTIYSLAEKHEAYADELAKEIASIFNSGELLEVTHKLYHKLYALICRAMKAFLLKGGEKRFRQSYLHFQIRLRQIRIAEIKQWVETEDYSELKSRQQEQGKLLDLMKVTENIESVSDRDASLHLLQENIEALTELERIAAMADFTEQTDAFSDYYAKDIILEILQLLMLVSGGTLRTQDIQRILKAVYLNQAHQYELEELARALGRHDIIEKYQTPIDKMIAEAKESKRIKLLTVLRNRIADNGT